MQLPAISVVCWSAALVTGAVLAQPNSATTVPPLSIEDFLKPAAFAEPTLSRNGKYFAVTIPVNGRRNLAVVDMDTRKGAALTNFRDLDVLNVTWVGNDYILYTLGQFNSPTGPGQFDGGGLFMTSRDGKETRKLSATVRELRGQRQYVYRAYDIYRTLPNSEDEIIATGNQRDADSTDLYRLNIKTGRATLLTQNRPEYSGRWLVDRKYVPRVVTSWVRDTQTFIVWYRKDENSQWEELSRYDRSKGPTFIPLTFEADNQTMQVAYNGGRDTMAIYRYDPNTKKMGELVAEHPRFDMGADASGSSAPGVVRDWKSDNIVGYRVRGDRPEVVWTDESYARLQRMIDGALPGTINSFSRTPDGKQLVVQAFSDTSPGKWFLLDEEKKTLEELFDSRPWIKPGQMVEQRPFRLKTRDGLEIPGYYFLPRGHKPGERLPTVLHIHGGPAARADTFGTGYGVREAQLLASRGYAVVLPNFRITPGFGGKVYYSGYGTIGRQMVDDHEDAAKWAVEQGFADSERICISGASYGGYATLMALARFPKTFRCGITGLMVSDWSLLVTSTSGDTAHSKAAVASVNLMLGAKSPSDYSREVSPVNLAEQIKQPVFVYAGADDIRTPIEQTNAMVSALRRAGNPPKKVIVKAEEGHGFGKPENNVELYKEMIEFLDTYIGPNSKR
ncbi:MAG: S9 family peptidase [Burkholderiaceae bacterium]|nr:S9 family peptidase [Burkholderiaceae bacterium]